MAKEVYLKLKEDFLERKESIIKIIEANQSLIDKKKKENSNLEKNLENFRPRIENCDNHMICKNCDIYSMKHEGTIPGQGERTYVYNCVICGYEGTHT